MIIKVCIPFYSEYEACKPGLAELREYRGHTFIITTAQGSVIASNRNHLVNDGESAKRSQTPPGSFDAYLFIDSDIEFCLQDVLSLIDRDEPITGLPYETHKGSELYQVGTWGAVPGAIKSRYNFSQKGWQMVDWIGGGMHLVKKEVYAHAEYPWYRHTLVQHNDLQSQTGEDVGFCLLAKESGYKIWCNFDRPVNHTKIKPKGNKMEEEQKLPGNIDEELVAIASGNFAHLANIGKGWKMMTTSIKLLQEKVETFEKEKVTEPTD